MDGELYTITFDEQEEKKGEKIPARVTNVNAVHMQFTPTDDVTNVNAVHMQFTPTDDAANVNGAERGFPDAPPIRMKPERNTKLTDDWEKRLAERQKDAQKVRSADDFYAKYGPPPSLSTKDILKRQGTPQLPPLPSQTTKKSFYETAVEYAGETREKTDHIPFLCYWPSYEYMSRPQLDWYFYLREKLRAGEYITTDLSYLFVYIYELLNQIGVDGPEDGFAKMVDIWKNYRETYDKLDRYLIDWAGDYIIYYNCDPEKCFELLEKENLFLLMPADMLMDHYMKNDTAMPLELIARFCDYKFCESEFIKGREGSLFTDHLPNLFGEIRRSMNQKEDGGFKTRFVPYANIKHTKIPFLRTPFNNKTNTRLQVYPQYEQHKPLRAFVTAVVKEFENELRTLTKHKGRLRFDALPAEIADICKKTAAGAVSGAKRGQTVEITIDRTRLLALIQDSDEVRRKLIEGNYEYGEEPQEPEENAGTEQPPPKPAESGFLSGLSPVQQKIIGFLSENGDCGQKEMDGAFFGVFVGVEIDRINEEALNYEGIGDLLIGFENDRWHIMEDYLSEFC